MPNNWVKTDACNTRLVHAFANYSNLNTHSFNHVSTLVTIRTTINLDSISNGKIQFGLVINEPSPPKRYLARKFTSLGAAACVGVNVDLANGLSTL